MKTAADLKVGDIINTPKSSYCLVGRIINFYCTEGAILKGTVEVLQLRKGFKPEDVEKTARFAFNKKTDLSNILYK
jgi:hypothetical protein